MRQWAPSKCVSSAPLLCAEKRAICLLMDRISRQKKMTNESHIAHHEVRRMPEARCCPAPAPPAPRRRGVPGPGALGQRKCWLAAARRAGAAASRGGINPSLEGDRLQRFASQLGSRGLTASPPAAPFSTMLRRLPEVFVQRAGARRWRDRGSAAARVIARGRGKTGQSAAGIVRCVGSHYASPATRNPARRTPPPGPTDTSHHGRVAAGGGRPHRGSSASRCAAATAGVGSLLRHTKSHSL